MRELNAPTRKRLWLTRSSAIWKSMWPRRKRIASNCIRENLELQLAVEKERAARLRLEERLGPRHIAQSQRQTIQSELAGLKGQKITIVTLPGDPEIAVFAGEIRATLEGAGVSVTMEPALVFGGPQAGISLEVGAARRQFAMALAKALVDAGVCSGAISATELDDPGLLEITVGLKP